MGGSKTLRRRRALHGGINGLRIGMSRTGVTLRGAHSGDGGSRDTPCFPLRTVSPVLVTVEAPSTAKSVAAPIERVPAPAATEVARNPQSICNLAAEFHGRSEIGDEFIANLEERSFCS
jgi:hypothetical protein